MASDIVHSRLSDFATQWENYNGKGSVNQFKLAQSLLKKGQNEINTLNPFYFIFFGIIPTCIHAIVARKRISKARPLQNIQFKVIALQSNNMCE